MVTIVIPYFGIFWPWLIIGLIRNLCEKAKNKHTKISLSRKFLQVMQTHHIPCLIYVCIYIYIYIYMCVHTIQHYCKSDHKRLTIVSTFHLCSVKIRESKYLTATAYYTIWGVRDSQYTQVMWESKINNPV